MRKISIIIMMLLLAAQSVFTPLVTKADEPQDNKEIKENILTNAVLTFENTVGQQVDQVDRSTIISVKYDWKLPNGHGYKSGATYQFRLPEPLVVYETIKEEPILFNGETIGTFSLDFDGTVKIVFNDFIETHSNIKGTIEVLSKISETVTITEDKKIIITPIADGKQIEIPIVFQPEGPTITKKGTPNKPYNTESIAWTIDFNKNLENIHSAVLKDPIQDGQELDANSVKVYKLITRLDGSVTQGEEVPGLKIEKTSDGRDFQINLGDIKSAYRVIYTTNIIDQDKTKYENIAFLTGKNFKEQSATGSVSVHRGVPLEKTSTKYDPVSQTITWEIKYNYNEKIIPKEKAILTDMFNDSQELLENSFTVKKVNIDSNGREGNIQDVDSSEYTLNKLTEEKQNGFKLKFNEDIQSAYKIVYKTKASSRVFENTKITNTVLSSENSKTAERTIYQQILSKSNDTTDYKNKTTSWTITFNKDYFPMNNVILTDTFTNKGLTLLPETLTISSSKGPMQVNEDYKLVVISDNEFKIEFLNGCDGPVTLKYKTVFNYEGRQDQTKTYLDNRAILVWEDENGKEHSKDANAQFTPDTYTQSNGFKNGSYNAINKEITWNIGVNYNLKSITDPSIVDIISGDQQLLLDSVKVYKMDLTGGANGTIQTELAPDTDYSVKWDESKKQLKIIFNKKIHSAYLITYKTSLNHLLIKDKYVNTASIYDGENKVTDLSASVSVPNGGKYIDKSGNQNGKIINWTANINFGQSYVSDVKLTDTPSPNQVILENSFHLYTTSVAENGSVSKGSELQLNKDYKLAYLRNSDGEDYFEITFPEPISKPYILEYQSMILAKVGESIQNNIRLTGKEITTEVTKSQSSVTVKRTIGMGTGEGEVGSLQVTKVDAADNKLMLEGAIFSLIDEQSGAVIKTLTTDKDGKVKFDKLLYGNYLLKEDRAPEGYVIGINDAQPIEIKAPTTEAKIENEKINHAVELTKIDNENHDLKLQGAEFKLQHKEGKDYKTVGTYLTNEEGKITLNNLEPGEYQFLESKAPKYYKQDDSPINFTIDKDQTSLKKVTKTNERGKGKLTIIKVDAANQNSLTGATFEIYNSKNNLVTTVTTDQDGKAFLEDVPYDKYTIKEVKAPDGYAVNHSDITVNVENSNTEITVKNNKIIHALKLVKVDANNPTKRLKDAVFKLLYKNAATDEYGIVEGKESLSTDANGEIYIENLIPGKYQLIEIKAPNGYILDNKPIEFEIKNEQISILSLTIKNRQMPSIPGGTDNPNNPGDTNNPDTSTNPGDTNHPDNPTNPGDTVNPGDANDPDKPTKSGDINNSDKPNAPGVTDVVKPKGENLPLTGENSNYTTLYIGSGFILMGLIILLYRRKEKVR